MEGGEGYMKKVVAFALTMACFCFQFTMAKQVELNDQTAAAFTTKIFKQWSSPNSTALPFFDSVYSDSVNFYGQSISHSDVMKNENSFAQRWQVREYDIEHITNDSCSGPQTTCSVSGIVHWIDFASGPKLLSIGDADFSYTLQEVNGTIEIVGQSGSTIDRNLINDSDTSPQLQTTQIPATTLSAITNSSGDWYVIDRSTTSCLDAESLNLPFQDPIQYVNWAQSAKGWHTNVVVEPNVPAGTWIEVQTSSNNASSTPQPSMDFFQPQGACEAALNYEQSQGALPNSTATGNNQQAPSPQSSSAVGGNQVSADSGTPASQNQTSSWYLLNNFNQCVATTISPADEIQGDQEDGLQDTYDIFETNPDQSPLAVKVEIPQANDMVSVLTYFKTLDACQNYLASQSQNLNQLK